MEQSHVVRAEFDGAAVITPIGAFDIASVDLLRDGLVAAFAEHTHTVLDLGQTTFMDSLALGAVAGAAKRAKAAGGWLRLVNPQPPVRKVLSITGLDTVLGLYDTVEQALQHRDLSQAEEE